MADDKSDNAEDARDVSLKEFLLTLMNLRFSHVEKTITDAKIELKESFAADMRSSKEAITKAESASKDRFESVNEFRGQMADQQATLVTKSEFSARFDSVEKQMKLIAEAQTRGQGKGEGIDSTKQMIIAIFGLILLGLAAYGALKPTAPIVFPAVPVNGAVTK